MKQNRTVRGARVWISTPRPAFPPPLTNRYGSSPPPHLRCINLSNRVRFVANLRNMELNRRRRSSLKSHTSNWKEKLRENCLKRVHAERITLLWKSRSLTPVEKIVESVFRDIVSDEFEKMKVCSSDSSERSLATKSNDDIWEYDGMHMDTNSSEDLLIELERLLYKDLQEEIIRTELATYEEEDEFLARAVFEHMQLNDGQACKNAKLWCPICKRGELREGHLLIYCTCCNLRLAVDGKGNLELLRDRLGEIHTQHLDRGCKVAPKFHMDTEFGLTALYMQCELCKSFDIVL